MGGTGTSKTEATAGTAAKGGVVNTGSGGGGTSSVAATNYSGSGSAGIVIIRYVVAA